MRPLPFHCSARLPSFLSCEPVPPTPDAEHEGRERHTNSQQSGSPVKRSAVLRHFVADERNMIELNLPRGAIDALKGIERLFFGVPLTAE